MDLALDGRRLLVVGASYGIGHAAALLMSKERAELLLAARSEEKLDAAASAIADACGQRPAVVAVDIAEDGAPDRLAADVETCWGALDGLVFCVGGSIRSAFEDLTDEDWMTHYRVNVLSAVATIRALLPALRRGRNPSVVVLGAAAARMPYPHQVVSNVHKAGLLGLVKTLAGELAPEAIRINCVAPGRTLTPLWTQRAAKMAAEEGVSPEGIIARFAADVPLGRFADPEEIAVMVTWLSSPRASYVTGQTVNVDGGIARGLL